MRAGGADRLRGDLLLASLGLPFVATLRLAGLFGCLGELGLHLVDEFLERRGFLSDLVVLPLAGDELLVELGNLLLVLASRLLGLFRLFFELGLDLRQYASKLSGLFAPLRLDRVGSRRAGP